ncbi:hypothetical protein HMI56_003296 [Coelomomyces lativittatus]|nr:hypothetical protein HMI56_003296 [Coelomomyces lativittatus]
MRHGHLKDLIALKESKGKFSIASEQPILSHEAEVFPSLLVHSVNPNSSPIDISNLFKSQPLSFFAISMTEFGNKQIDTFFNPLRDTFPSIPRYQISTAPSWLSLKILHWYRSRIRKSKKYPDEYYHTLTPGFPTSLSSILLNQHLGYVLLVDQHAHIRWHAHGFAMADELVRCRNVVHALSGPGAFKLDGSGTSKDSACGVST